LEQTDPFSMANGLSLIMLLRPTNLITWPVTLHCAVL